MVPYKNQDRLCLLNITIVFTAILVLSIILIFSGNEKIKIYTMITAVVIICISGVFKYYKIEKN